jgi:hypothetical protein
MKYLGLLMTTLVLAVSFSGCFYKEGGGAYTVPAGYTRCNNDNQCDWHHGYYCRFITVDSVPVCTQS